MSINDFWLTISTNQCMHLKELSVLEDCHYDSWSRPKVLRIVQDLIIIRRDTPERYDLDGSIFS